MAFLAVEPDCQAIPFRPQFPSLWNAVSGNALHYRSWADFRDGWRELPTPSREMLLCHLYDKFCTFGYVGVKYADSLIENTYGKRLLSECLASNIDDWSHEALSLATTFWLFESAGILLTEYNQKTLELQSIEGFAAAKYNQYLSLAGRTDSINEHSLIPICKQIGALRGSIPKHYTRCFSINGETWEREERYLDNSVATDTVYPCVSQEIEVHLGHHLPQAQTPKESLQALVDIVASQSINPFEILVAITRAALRDTVLAADYAVVTVPQGRGLDTPWNITIADVCSYAAVRKHFDPTSEGVEFQCHQIVRAIERRMRFNTACRSKNYHPLREVRRQAQPFQFPDIAINESSHHLGHIKTGINNSARTHFEISIPSLARFGEFRGFGDFRVNRVDNSPLRRFAFDELAHLLPYGEWCKIVFDYSIGKNIFMDANYCTTA